MALATDDPNDPAAQLRRRVTAQLAPAATDPLAPAAVPSPAKMEKHLSPAPLGDSVLPPAKLSPAGDAMLNAAPETPEAPAAPAAPAPAAPAAPTAGRPVIPTNPDGSQVGGGTPWDPKTGAPGYAPPGYHWDPNLAMFQPGDAPGGVQKPTMGKLTDPNFAAQFVAWAGSQPGVNPSVKNDPQYWIQKFQSGAFGDDQNYALQRMMQAEGAPEGGGGAAAATPMPAATSAFTDQVRKMLMDRMGRDTAAVNENDSYIKQPMDAASLEAGRNQQMERTALAERAAAQGDTSGSVNMGIQQSAERNAVGLGSLKAKLIGQEYQSRRADLNDAMQSALNSGDKETAYQLQMALAQLDAQLRREGYGVNMSEFAADQNRLASNQVTS